MKLDLTDMKQADTIFKQASKQASKQGITAPFCHALKLYTAFVMDNRRILTG